MKIEAGIFDLGGVVVRTSDVKEIKNDLNIDSRALWRLVRMIAEDVQTGKTTEEELLEYLRKVLKTEAIPDDLFERKYRESFGLIDGSVDIIVSLRRLGLTTTALSNTIPSHERVMRDSGVFELFDHEVLSFEAGLRKPDPRIYEMALVVTGVPPEKTFFVDDVEKNVRAAEVLGINVILFEDPNQLRTDLRDMGLEI